MKEDRGRTEEAKVKVKQEEKTKQKENRAMAPPLGGNNRVNETEEERLAREQREQRERDEANRGNNRLQNVKAKCPVFSEDCHYPTFKTTCQAYLALHDVPIAKQGLVLAMNALPDTGANNIKQRYFDENKIEEMNCPGGIDLFWKFLDDIYEKDPLMEMCSRLRDLIHYKRQNDTNIKDYISEFDARYQRAIAKKVPKLPDELLMWLLLEGSGIAESEKRLVMVEVDLGDTANIFKNTKNSMKKLFSGLLSGDTEQPRMIADTFYAGGNRGGGSNRGFRGRGGFTPNRGRGQGFRGGYGFNPTPPGRGGYPTQRLPAPGTASGGGQSPYPHQGSTKNPPLNGQPRFCHSCGSDSHFMAACPQKLGWPAFYAGMCQGQQLNQEEGYDQFGYGQDQYGYGQDQQWEDQGDQGQGQGGYFQEHQGQGDPQQFVQTENQEQSLIGAAAALHLSEAIRCQGRRVPASSP